MKSLSIFFRSEYGLGEIEYELFQSKDITRFESIVLRNSGNDFTSQGNSMFRDGLMSTLVNDTEIDNNAFQPSVVYLNGEYWGIHNIREKLNEHYVESNSSADSDNIDLIGNGGGLNHFAAVHGSAEEYNSLLNYATSKPLVFTQFYEEIENMIDIDNYIDYHLAQIYYANTDWPGNNIKIWRSRNQDGKWRWILYDTDFGFGIWDPNAYTFNTLQFALKDNWVSDYIAIFNNEKSTQIIESVSESIVIEISINEGIENVFSKFPEIETLHRKNLQRHIVSLQKRVLNQLQLTSFDRYKIFLNQYPEIEKYALNYHIASYLGITPQSLSRLRSKNIN